MVLEVPRQWPAEVSLFYEPARVLGKGGFGSVLLGRRKADAPDTWAEADPQVAIKVVGSQQVTDSELGYAHREMDILQELSHPNIMKVLRHWEPNPDEHLCAAVMVLSYASGPTLYDLVRPHGALGLAFCRVVLAQVIDALAYLHSRAVVHRDIKADNVVITGATLQQDEIWEDDKATDRDWQALTNKWHVTLVDFGFARALTPADMKKNPPKGEKPTRKKSLNASSSGQQSLGNSSRSLRRSVSRLLTRQMSAVGNRDYAAPEITKKVVQMEASQHHATDILHTLSKNQSYYGLQVDAYSMGVLARYVLTGVPVHEDVEEFISLQNNPFLLLFKCCANNKPGERQRRYRTWSKLPKEAFRMIKGLTHYDPQQRTTIRTARRYPYVDDVLEGDGPDPKIVDYLDLVKKQEASSDVPGETSSEAPKHEA